jgi:hypothetical protein
MAQGTPPFDISQQKFLGGRQQSHNPNSVVDPPIRQIKEEGS